MHIKQLKTQEFTNSISGNQEQSIISNRNQSTYIQEIKLIPIKQPQSLKERAILGETTVKIQKNQTINKSNKKKYASFYQVLVGGFDGEKEQLGYKWQFP